MTSPPRWAAGSLIASVLFVELGSAILMIGLPLFVLDRYELALDGALAIGLRYLPGVVLGGWLNYALRHVNPRFLAATATVGIAVIAMAIPATTELWQVQLLSVALGLCTTVDVPSRLTMRSWVTSPGNEQQLNSLIVAVERIGLTIGPLLAAGISIVAGVKGNFFVQALLAVPAILTLLLVPRPSHVEDAPQPDQASQTGPSTRLRALVSKFDPVVVAYSVTALLYMCGVGIRTIYLPIHSDGTTAALGIYTASLAVGGIVGGILATRLRGNREVLYMLGSVLEGICWLVLAAGVPLAAEMATLFVAGVFESAATAVFLTAIQVRLRPESIGPYYGWLIPSNDAFIFLGVAIAGLVATTTDRNIALPVLIAVFSAIPVLVLWTTFVKPLFVRTQPSLSEGLGNRGGTP
ncbi:MFS transporter [Rathayibacter toxicus]|uniref:MFS transporter n=1 Tax=Rathayibacter toxicus TaxID=145458 RepID=A0A0C5BT03_9MICO|nr:MFS transporter [Rathayibacter toxicus]AJM77817.1 hypothetical protein TI83_07385 [Rathayibacter toxicus]ALS58000.1 hypothetical protein APU90_09690 [Rathayibacter toxicus]KKM44290.1 hypothetical protein VT73_10330 [Rathayibacter toxicus]PPG20314.1 MFS transporter [Rathayibacter toxicus]PPG45415.1 MFS transporter [Rathayibacter toxicus]